LWFGGLRQVLGSARRISRVIFLDDLLWYLLNTPAPLQDEFGNRFEHERRPETVHSRRSNVEGQRKSGAASLASSAN
jgi:hypothetical protein